MINLCDHFHSLERVVLFRALFSSVEVIISIEATAIGCAWRCLYAQPRCPASFYWEMANCYLPTNKCM